MEWGKERKKEALSDLCRIICSLSWDLCFFVSPELVFALKENHNFLVTAALYLLHHALKISEMSDGSSGLSEIMLEMQRVLLSLTAPCSSAVRLLQLQGEGITGGQWSHHGHRGAEHAQECTWIQMMGCYGDGRLMMLFADSLTVPCQTIRCHGAARMLQFSIGIRLCLSWVTAEANIEKKQATRSKLSALSLHSWEQCESTVLPWLLQWTLVELMVITGFNGLQVILELAQWCCLLELQVAVTLLYNTSHLLCCT